MGRKGPAALKNGCCEKSRDGAGAARPGEIWKATWSIGDEL